MITRHGHGIGIPRRAAADGVRPVRPGAQPPTAPGRPRHRAGAGAPPRRDARRHASRRTATGRAGAARFAVRLPMTGGARCPSREAEPGAPMVASIRCRRTPAGASWSSTTTTTPPSRWRCCSAGGHEVRTAHDGARSAGAAERSSPRSCCSTSACRRWTATRARRLRRRLGQAACASIALTGWGQQQDRDRTPKPASTPTW